MDINLKKALRMTILKLEGLEYLVIGSMSLYLHGINVSPRDIDIITTPEILEEIIVRLKEYQTKEVYFDKTEGRNSWRTFFDIEGIEVEVLCNVDNLAWSKNISGNKVFVECDGIFIPCVSLEASIIAYEKMLRLKKVGLIKNFLNKPC